MPLYNKIVDTILEKIKKGSLKKGDKLPTELELSHQFNVSRPTVRTALLKLSEQGYLNRIKGCGTFITNPKVVQESTRFIESYNQEMLEKGLTPKTEVLEFRTIPASDIISEKLKIKSGDNVIKLKRLRYVVPDYADKPVVLTTVYIPYAIADFVLNYDLETMSLYDVLNKNNIVISRVEQELEIKLLNKKSSRLLNAKENSPAHFISSVGFTEDNNVIDYAESFYPADRNKFLIKITR